MARILLSAAFVVICALFFVPQTEGVSRGAVRIYRNGGADFSQTYSAGIVQIYYSFEWGNICDDFSFDQDEADVVCHQLAYTGASSFSNTGTTLTYGIDIADTAMDDVSCSSSNYLTITQCSFSTSFISSTCTDNRDVIVNCYSTRIWSSPTTGDIRLTDGTYSNQGLLEVYCNGEWGTVCDDNFYATEATVACRQLGYNDYDDYDHLSQEGTSSQEIWLRYFGTCFSSYSCLTRCDNCPISGVTICSHFEDVTLECEYDSSSSKVYTDTTDDCSIYTESSSASAVVGAIVGSIILFFCCVGIFTIVPICICCCLGVGLGSAARGSSRRGVVTTQAAATSVVVTQEQKAQQSGYAPQPVPMGGYPTQQQQPPPAYPTQQQQPPTGYPTQPAAGMPLPGYPPQPDPGYPTAYPPAGQQPYPDSAGGYPPQPYPDNAGGYPQQPPPY